MKRTFLLLILAACGSKSAPSPTIGNNAGSGTPEQTAIPPGDYTCRFSDSSGPYDAYRCQVGAGATPSIEKVGGMERFTGTLSPSGHDLTIEGVALCDDGSSSCQFKFTGTLTFEDNGLWKGTLAGPSEWWLNGGQLELSYDPDGSGLGYGGAGYGAYDEEPEGD